MLEAEISPAGDVTVEGHHVGALQGFRFTADPSAGGEDAKAVKTAAQKALAAEFEARAERFANSPNGDFALASDGLLRWIGAPVATLAASEDALAPRLILLADEQLTGPSRDRVMARAERFVRYQIDTLLKPLVDLKAAEQLSGLARGIAFQLVENFGAINRRDIADDVKALDQEARAALRRLGVRFGAFHIFVPALTKPGPAGLVTLLWALQNDGKERNGFGDVVNALASGRTSLVVEADFDPAFYRLAGYRTLGRRAVRVDILERLADLIRPALSWRAGSGPRPDGAYDGAAFTVTPAMMSILGATPEDMEEILRALGYRSEAKPAADVQARIEALDAAEQERIAQAAAARAAAAQAQTEAKAQTEPETEQSESDVAEPQPEADETVAAAGAEPETMVQAASEQIAEAEEPTTEATEVTVSDAASVSEPASDAAPATASEAPVETPAEEAKPILLWRPARFEGRGRHGRHGAPGNRQPQRDGERRFAGRRTQQGAADADGKRDEAGAGGRNNRSERWKGKPRDNKQASGQERSGKPPRNQRNPQHGDQNARKREERPARIDPDSPFAKLAALREQLKGK